ncbi:SMC-Scp complex subunit ScpB [Mycoplasmopsis pulmonis]|nr:SMC-Scp complex subunit ScpB [Mycoplasmopsis pulmonis]MDZ7293086.1 SMC-Scp complex subunit ScpB [Mycoplasmopsis pulmonis]VEU67879.1 segregation and condensation protein B [Mycoplasmopsis pulmonis]
MKNKIIEALMYFQGDQGLSPEQVKEVFDLEKDQEGKKLLNDFMEFYNAREGGTKVFVFGEIYKIATIEPLKDYVSKLVSIVRYQKLSKAAIEVAGIVAYKQPITKSMINEIRGVASDQVVNTLLVKNLIEEVGISPTPGKPVLYGITNKFYDYFKIKSLQELPNLSEFDFVQSIDEEQEEEQSYEGFNLFSSQREN